MRKLLSVAFFISLITANLYCDGLYDVNYDSPVFMSDSFDETEKTFQDIYLQYEKNVKAVEERIRSQERSRYQEEIRLLQASEKEKYEIALAQAREEIYQTEIEAVRQKATERIKEEVRAELELQFENKKRQELEEAKKQIRKDLKIEVAEENHSATERLRIVLFYISLFIGGAVLLLIVQRCISNSKKVEEFKKEYYSLLCEHGGDETALLEDVEKNQKWDETAKKLRRQAISKAKETYERIKDLKPLSSYRDQFERLNPHSIFEKWNGAGHDIELKNGLCNNFYKNINEYSNVASELYYSRRLRKKEEKEDISRLLKTHSQTLEFVSERVEKLIEEDMEKDFKKKLLDIAKKYSILSKKFAKELF